MFQSSSAKTATENYSLQLCFPVVKMKYIWRELGEGNLSVYHSFAFFSDRRSVTLRKILFLSAFAGTQFDRLFPLSQLWCWRPADIPQLISSTLLSPIQDSWLTSHTTISAQQNWQPSLSLSWRCEVVDPARHRGLASREPLPPRKPSERQLRVHFMQKLAACSCSHPHPLCIASTLFTLDTGKWECCSAEGNEPFLYTHLFQLTISACMC